MSGNATHRYYPSKSDNSSHSTTDQPFDLGVSGNSPVRFLGAHTSTVEKGVEERQTPP